MAPIARERHLGGLASGMGVSSQTACRLRGSASPLNLADWVAAVSSLDVDGLSKGNGAGGVSRSDLFDSAPDWGVICTASILKPLGVEERAALPPAPLFRNEDEATLRELAKKLLKRIGVYRDSPRPGNNKKATVARTQTTPARAAFREGE